MPGMSDYPPYPMYDHDVRILREAKARYGDELLSLPNVHGIGIGYRQVDGVRTGELAIVVHVHHKLAREQLAPDTVVPARLSFFSRQEGKEVTVLTDVRQAVSPTPEVACRPCAANFGARVRPVPGGYSVGLYNEPGGTLGGWMWDEVEDQVVLISNHHVLGGVQGNVVIQPSIGDGGASPADDFARVVRQGTFDVSVARPVDGDDVASEIECSTGAVFEVAEATVGMEIEKVGQTTGLTCGLVELIDYDSGHYGSRADLWIDGDGSNFSEGGDSGSLYVEKSHPEGSAWKRVIGIHWGGSGDDGVGHPMQAITSDVGVTTLCDGILTHALEGGPGNPGTRRRRDRLWPPHSLSKAGLARDLERRFTQTETGRRISQLLSTHRMSVVRVLLDGDGRRATLALTARLMGGAITTDDVLRHRLVEEDVAAAERLVRVVERVSPEAKELTAFASYLLGRARGATVEELLTGSTQ